MFVIRGRIYAHPVYCTLHCSPSFLSRQKRYLAGNKSVKLLGTSEVRNNWKRSEYKWLKFRDFQKSRTHPSYICLCEESPHHEEFSWQCIGLQCRCSTLNFSALTLNKYLPCVCFSFVINAPVVKYLKGQTTVSGLYVCSSTVIQL